MAGKKGTEKRGSLSRVQEARVEVDLYSEELKESLVEAETGSSGFTEERDVDERITLMEETAKGKEVGKKGKRR